MGQDRAGPVPAAAHGAPRPLLAWEAPLCGSRVPPRLWLLGAGDSDHGWWLRKEAEAPRGPEEVARASVTAPVTPATALLPPALHLRACSLGNSRAAEPDPAGHSPQLSQADVAQGPWPGCRQLVPASGCTRTLGDTDMWAAVPTSAADAMLSPAASCLAAPVGGGTDAPSLPPQFRQHRDPTPVPQAQP